MSDGLKVWLSRELEKRRWSQRELARQSGISQPLISQTMSGEVSPSAEFCIKIAQALDESPEIVLRLAGILPPALPALPSDPPALQEMVELARRLTPEQLREALNYIRYLYQANNKK
jgi:transcriptional regulator with XRE-family HTH domain